MSELIKDILFSFEKRKIKVLNIAITRGATKYVIEVENPEHKAL